MRKWKRGPTHGKKQEWSTTTSFRKQKIKREKQKYNKISCIKQLKKQCLPFFGSAIESIIFKTRRWFMANIFTLCWKRTLINIHTLKYYTEKPFYVSLFIYGAECFLSICKSVGKNRKYSIHFGKWRLQ